MNEDIKEFLDLGGEFRILKQHDYYLLTPHIVVHGSWFRKGVKITSSKFLTKVFPEVAAVTLTAVERMLEDDFDKEHRSEYSMKEQYRQYIQDQGAYVKIEWEKLKTRDVKAEQKEAYKKLYKDKE